MSHAKLSPSAATRWMACTPSAVLEQSFPNTSSSYADEGTLAHAVCEALLRLEHHIITQVQFYEKFEELKRSEYYSDHMLTYCEDYVAFVNDLCKGEFHIFIEQKLDMTNWVPEGFGTADAVIILPQERKIIFVDLKYGKGIRVDSKQNSQLKIYSLGVLQTMEFIFGENAFDIIETHIYQPRMDNISTYSYTVPELLKWATDELKPKADLAFDGKGEYKAGNHCYWCRAKATCRTLYEFNMDLAKHDFKNPDLLTDEEILDVYARISIFENWISAVSEHILTEALKGKVWTGYKVVEGRSNRAYSDQSVVAETLKAKGFTDIYKAPALLGLGELEKKITKVKFNEIVGPLLIKPKGKPAIAPADDKRPTWSDDVSNDFQVEI